MIICPLFGAGGDEFWRRCNFVGETCAAKRYPVHQSGAGVPIKNTPAPKTRDTCAATAQAWGRYASYFSPSTAQRTKGIRRMIS